MAPSDVGSDQPGMDRMDRIAAANAKAASKMSYVHFTRQPAYNPFEGNGEPSTRVLSADAPPFNPTAPKGARNSNQGDVSPIAPPNGVKPKVCHVSQKSLIPIKTLHDQSEPEPRKADYVKVTDLSMSQDGAADVSNLLQNLTFAQQAGPSPDYVREYGHEIARAEWGAGRFTADEDVSRSFVVKRIPSDVDVSQLLKVLNVNMYPSTKDVNFTHLESDGKVFVSFFDVRDAARAFEAMKSAGQWPCSFTAHKEHMAAVDPNVDVSNISNFEGHVLITVHYAFEDARLPSARNMLLDIKARLEAIGPIKALCTLRSTMPGEKHVFVEYYDTRISQQAIDSVHMTEAGPFCFEAKYHRPDVTGPTPPPTNGRPYGVTSGIFGQPPPAFPVSPSGIPFGNMSATQGLNPLMKPPSSRGRQSPPSRFGRMPWPRRQKGESNPHNVVYIELVETGQDVRQTVMIRNIPNRIDQPTMKKILDMYIPGGYDFMYLRIDFYNNVNVGYCFINCPDQQAIVTLHRAIVGHWWSEICRRAGAYNRVFGRGVVDKKVEISYATVQGRDCLIAKFRNSAVLLENPLFTPKLYVTGTGPDAGKEEEFPEPDNYSKMQRSYVNAEAVGLFPPRAGQHFRNEQRQRQSQFDRGTTAAEHESFVEGHVDPARGPMNPPHIIAAPAQIPSFYNYGPGNYARNPAGTSPSPNTNGYGINYTVPSLGPKFNYQQGPI